MAGVAAQAVAVVVTLKIIPNPKTRSVMTSTKSETLLVRQLPLGPKKNFVYLVGSAESSDVAVIDPAWDIPALRVAASAEGKNIAAVLLTHQHADHLNGVPELLRHHDVPVYVQAAEYAFAPLVFRSFQAALQFTKPNQVLSLAGTELKCLHTPGHTVGAQCFFSGDALFSGDTLFVNACGRCDFEGGDPSAMHRSLVTVLGALPRETRVFPGHDYGDVPVSTIGRELERNPYFQWSTTEDFVRYRMAPK